MSDPVPDTIQFCNGSCGRPTPHHHYTDTTSVEWVHPGGPLSCAECLSPDPIAPGPLSTETALAPILERRAAIDEQIEALQGQRDALDDVIRTIVAAEPGTYEAANGMTVQLRVNRRLDVKALERAYPAASCPQFYEPKLSTTKLRRHVAEVELEDLYVVGTPSVVTK